jgi:hypothetical protein
MHAGRRARIATRDGHRCKIKGCENPGPYEVDHVINLAIGGKDDDDNCRLLCVPCHKIKTAYDLKIIAKAKRCERQADPETRRRGKPIASRPFGKSTRKIASRPFNSPRSYGERG